MLSYKFVKKVTFLLLKKRHGELGYNALIHENYKDGLLNLRKADIILNAYISNEGKVSQDILILIKVNLGICFYKIGLLEESYTCFETCIMSSKNKQKNKQNTNELGDYINNIQ